MPTKRENYTPKGRDTQNSRAYREKEERREAYQTGKAKGAPSSTPDEEPTDEDKLKALDAIADLVLEEDREEDRIKNNVNLSDPQQKAYTVGTAHELMRIGYERGDIYHALRGAQLYAKIEGGYVPQSVKNRLEQTMERAEEMHNKIKEHYKNYEKIAAQTKEFLDKVPVKKGSLESKVMAGVALISLAAGLLFLSSNITGNVISNMTNSSSNATGIVLILIGALVGYFYLKK